MLSCNQGGHTYYMQEAVWRRRKTTSHKTTTTFEIFTPLDHSLPYRFCGTPTSTTTALHRPESCCLLIYINNINHHPDDEDGDPLAASPSSLHSPCYCLAASSTPTVMVAFRVRETVKEIPITFTWPWVAAAAAAAAV